MACTSDTTSWKVKSKDDDGGGVGNDDGVKDGMCDDVWEFVCDDACGGVCDYVWWYVRAGNKITKVH